MNTPMRDGDEDAIDRLLFQYLEGELPAEQAKALEARIAVDAALQAQLEYWQEAFVRQDFYDTTALEASLLRKPAKMLYSPAAFYAFLLVTVTALLYPLPVAIEKYPATPALRPVQPPHQADATQTSVPFNRPARQGSSTARRNRYLPVSEETSPETTLNRILGTEEIHSVPQIRTLPEGDTASVRMIPLVKVRQISLPKVVAGKTLTRKERRQLVRMKEKARQTRQANKFIKGNVPYVVPLDLKNF